MSLISICVTTYNRGNTLALTIDSILNQTHTDFELIISDDNSQDDTQTICEDFCKKDSRVKYYRNIENLKMPGNLNNAISKAQGAYIANLHDGDIYRPDLIEKWYNALHKYPEALFVFNQYNWLDEKGNFKLRYDHLLAEVNNGKVLMEYFLNTLSSAPWGTVMARRKAYEEFGLFDANYGFISDVEMWLRLGLNGNVCYVSEPLIDLTPREKNHPYYLPHWRIFCLNSIILFKYYLLFSAKYPALINNFPLEKIYDKLGKEAFRMMAVLLKHGDYQRLQEGSFFLQYIKMPQLRKISRLFFFIKSKKPAYLKDLSTLADLITKIQSS